jgi:hypothetical protein
MSDEQPKKKRPFTAVALGALAVAAFVLLFWRGPWWFDGAHIRDTQLEPADGVVITGFRTGLVAIGAGILAGAGLWYTHRSHRHAEKLYEHAQEQFAHARKKDDEQAALTREGQVTDRYVQAIKLLASDKLHERLGGIYALERIMKDSDRDLATVVEVLAAFIRTYGESGPSSPADAEAALSVIGRRPDGATHEINLMAAHLSGTSLASPVLNGVNLQAAELVSIHWHEARLQGAQLSHAKLEGARLFAANLENSVLFRADLASSNCYMTDFSSANLDNANFTAADLKSATFSDASLTGTNFYGVDLRGATGLHPEGIMRAHIYENTELPPELAANPAIQQRIAECEAMRAAEAEEQGIQIL